MPTSAAVRRRNSGGPRSLDPSMRCRVGGGSDTIVPVRVTHDGAINRGGGHARWDRLAAMNPTELRRAFRDIRVAHVATVLPDGSPHVVPLWFVWLEDASVVTCRRGSRVWSTLGPTGGWPSTAAGKDVDGARRPVGARQRRVPGAGRPPAPSGPCRRGSRSTGPSCAGLGFAAYTEQVAQPVVARVVIERVAGWNHAYRPGH